MTLCGSAFSVGIELSKGQYPGSDRFLFVVFFFCSDLNLYWGRPQKTITMRDLSEVLGQMIV